jgi:hypothetical protein
VDDLYLFVRVAFIICCFVCKVRSSLVLCLLYSAVCDSLGCGCVIDRSFQLECSIYYALLTDLTIQIKIPPKRAYVK